MGENIQYWSILTAFAVNGGHGAHAHVHVQGSSLTLTYGHGVRLAFFLHAPTDAKILMLCELETKPAICIELFKSDAPYFLLRIDKTSQCYSIICKVYQVYPKSFLYPVSSRV